MTRDQDQRKRPGRRADESEEREDTTEGEDFERDEERRGAGPRKDEPEEREDTIEGEDFDDADPDED